MAAAGLTEPRCASDAVSPWEAGAPRSAASRCEAAANPWLGAIARCSRTGSSNPSPSVVLAKIIVIYQLVMSQIPELTHKFTRSDFVDAGERPWRILDSAFTLYPNLSEPLSKLDAIAVGVADLDSRGRSLTLSRLRPGTSITGTMSTGVEITS